MNYLEPGDVVDAVVEKLESVRLELKYKLAHIKDVQEIADFPDADEDGIEPPWLGVFYNFEDDGDVMEDGSVSDLPITIGVLCSSTPGQQTETASLREAMNYARQVRDHVIGEYIIDVGTVEEPDERIIYIRAKPKPREIMQADPELSLVVAKFDYRDSYE